MSERFDVDPGTEERVTAEAIRRGRQLRLRRRLVGVTIALAVVVAGGSVAVAARSDQGSRVALVSPSTATAGAARGTRPTTTATTGPAIPQLPNLSSPTPGLLPTSSTVTSNVPPPGPGSTTTAPAGGTTTAGLPSCTGGQIVRTESTARGTYPPGEAIVITETQRNTADACADTKAVTTGCWAGELNIYGPDNASTLVWEEDASSTIEPPAGFGCPAAVVGAPVPAGFSQSFTFTWDQNECTLDTAGLPGNVGMPNPDCPDTQVGPGTYTIVNTSPSVAPITVAIG